MDVVFKNIKKYKDKDHHQEQKQKDDKDKFYHHLDQDSIKAKLADTYIFNSSKNNDKTNHFFKKSFFIDFISKYKRFILITFLFIAFLLFILNEFGFKNSLDLRHTGDYLRDNTFFGNNTIQKEAIVLTNLNFYGNISDNAKLTQGYIYLSKKRGQKTAGVEIRLKEPIENKSGALTLLAKGEIGEEKLVIILRDETEPGADYVNEIRLMPHFGNLSQNWQKVFIPFNQIRERDLLAKIHSIAFEITDSKKSNLKASCYLKDIILINE